MDKKKIFEFLFGVSTEVFSEKVIVTPIFQASRSEKYCNAVSRFKGRLYSGFTAEKNGRPVTVVFTGIGSQLAGDAVLLMGETAARELVFTGTCGGLNDCRAGDLMIAEDAFHGEGFSGYHDKNFDIKTFIKNGKKSPSDPGYTKKLSDFLRDKIDPVPGVRAGSIFTIGSLLAETSENLSCMEDEGFTGIEMELSAVYYASRAAGIKASGLLVVSDTPIASGALGVFPGPGEREVIARGIEAAIRFSLEFATRE